MQTSFLAGPTGALSAAIMTAIMPLLALPVNGVMRGFVRRSLRSASSCSPLSASSGSPLGLLILGIHLVARSAVQ
jgi:hypothetical protein